MALLRVDPGLIIWLFVVFGIVLLVLRLTAWDKIIGALDKRSARISSDLESAQQAKEQGDKLLVEYQAKLAEGRLEAARIIEQGRAEASRQKDDMLRQTKEEIRQMRTRAEVEIKRDREEAEMRLRNEVVSLSLSVAEALLRREVKSPENRAFVEEFAQRLTASSGGEN